MLSDHFIETYLKYISGSTNTIVYTTTGVSDVLTSTLHIVLGKEYAYFTHYFR